MSGAAERVLDLVAGHAEDPVILVGEEESFDLATALGIDAFADERRRRVLPEVEGTDRAGRARHRISHETRSGGLARHALDDSESLQVVASLVKQRRDSIEQFTKGGRQDLVDKEAAEIRVLEHYLPPAVDAADVERAVVEAIAETGATSAKEMGRVMKAVMAKLAGQTVDGKAVNELVRKKLAGS